MHQPVAIQLPSTDDGEGFLWNNWFKNLSVVEHYHWCLLPVCIKTFIRKIETCFGIIFVTNVHACIHQYVWVHPIPQNIPVSNNASDQQPISSTFKSVAYCVCNWYSGNDFTASQLLNFQDYQQALWWGLIFVDIDLLILEIFMKLKLENLWTSIRTLCPVGGNVLNQAFDISRW